MLVSKTQLAEAATRANIPLGVEPTLLTAPLLYNQRVAGEIAKLLHHVLSLLAPVKVKMATLLKLLPESLLFPTV